MAILYCQKTIFPNSSAHALHTASTAAHFAGAAVPTSVFPAIPPCGGFGLLEKFYAGIGAHPLPPALRIDAIRCRQKGIYSLLFRYKLLKAMRVEPFPLCFASSVKEAVIALDLRKFLPAKKKAPVVFEIHHLISRLKKGKQADRLFALEKKAFTEADLVVFNCEALREQAVGYLPEPARAMVSPLGYNEKVIRPLRGPELAEPGEVRNEVRLAYVGSLQRGKGVESLVRSLALLPENYLLRIIGGKPEPELERLRELAARAGTNTRIEFVGHVTQDRVGKLLRDADMFVIPLETETDFLAPMKMFEAVGFGLPIVATRMPSLTGLLSEPDNAIFAPATGPDGLAEAIARLGEDCGLRKTMRKNNTLLSQTLSTETRTQRLLDAFADLFGKGVLT